MSFGYRYMIEGTATQDQTWVVSGERFLEARSEFPFLVTMCLRDSFQQLTNGNAVFGKPGLDCRGPYSVRKLVIEEITQENEMSYQVRIGGNWRIFTNCIPDDAEAIGTVYRKTGDVGGALVRFNNGNYVQMINGVIRNLDQTKVILAALGLKT